MVKDTFKLIIPNKPEYISVARLTSSSIASKAGFNIDDIDDIKVSIAEACINALNKSDQIEITFILENDKLSVMVSDFSLNGCKECELGILIIKSLMDEVNFLGKTIEMVKYLGAVSL